MSITPFNKESKELVPDVGLSRIRKSFDFSIISGFL